MIEARREARPGAVRGRRPPASLTLRILAVQLLAAAAVGVLGAAAVRVLLPEAGIAIGLLAILITAVALIVHGGVAALVARLAAAPLELLAGTAARLRRGEHDLAVPPGIASEPHAEELLRTLAGAVESAAADRARMRDMAGRAFRAQEEERRHIAHQLQDGTAQTLAALLIQLRVARQTEDGPTRDGVLDAVRDELASALEELKRFSRGLRPPALDELGVVAAIEAYGRLVADGATPRIAVTATGLDERVPPEIELALYRIVQEALSNVARHAAAAEVDIRLDRDGERVRVTVSDDGAGFDVDDVTRRQQCLGLFRMYDRAAYVGGMLRIHSAPGAGTRIEAELPIVEIQPASALMGRGFRPSILPVDGSAPAPCRADCGIAALLAAGLPGTLDAPAR
jgi:two-component system, NarL family, sensor histidine kinase UhpB